MQTPGDKRKLGQTMIQAAEIKRRRAQALWAEADEDFAKGQMLTEEATREEKARTRRARMQSRRKERT